MTKTDDTESLRTPSAEPEVDQPGLGRLREAVANHAARRTPGRPKLRRDGLAGLNTAISSVPDGMASGILAGVNPVYGLYAGMAGPIIGGIFSSTRLMMITTTAAASLTAGEAIAGLPPAARDNALFVMVVLAGALQILFGLLGLGRLTRFVSYSVMTGFLTGIAVLLVLSQLSTVTGYEAAGDNRITQTLNLLVNLGKIDLPSLALAALTLALAAVLPRTRLGSFGTLAAIAVPSVLVALFRLDSVQIVRDIADIGGGVPTLDLPSFLGVTFNVLTGALAVSVVVLVQGAGVSQSVPNPDGSRSRASRDFIAQGAANIASGIFRGLPVGGSLGTTALNVVSGARTRWAAIFSGLWMAAIVVGFSGPVSYVAMPALGALIVLAGVRTIKPSDLVSIWSVGWPSRLAIVTTFLATLFLPIQAAVGIGVVLSALLYLNKSSTDVSVVELVQRPDGRIQERRPPKRLPADSVTVLDVYGHLFYAGARTLERLLPEPEGGRNPVVILRLRGRTDVGATLVEVLSGYARKLQAVNGRLYLAGLSEKVHDRLVRNGKLRLTGPVRAYEATPIRGESTRQAYADAQAWLASMGAEAAPDEAPPGGAPEQTP